MKTNSSNPLTKPAIAQWAIFASLAAVSVIASLTFAPNVFAQADKPANPPAARYQISAWAFGDAGRSERGCYVVDTATGELWVTHADLAPKRIGEKLK